MLTIIILLYLAFAFYTGYRRGLAMQLVRLIGYVITFILSTRFFEPLSRFAEMLIPFPAIQQGTELVIYDEAISFHVGDAFYRAITFAMIFLIGLIVTHFLSQLFNQVMYYTRMTQINYIGGGVINFLVSYLIVFVILFILSLIPIEFVQQQFVDNPLAYWIVTQTPLLSTWANDAWLNVTSMS